MKYQNAKLRQLLAGQYVLGTLRGRARRRFQRLLVGDAGLRSEVRFWEQRLAGFDGNLAPVQPREIVWINLAQRLGFAPAPAARSTRFWQAWAGLATAASALLALALWRQEPPPAPPPVGVQAPAPIPYVGVLQVPGSEVRWVVSLTPERSALAIAAVGTYQPEAGKALELWWLNQSGPVSLGLLPASGELKRALPQNLDLAGGSGLAISLEPEGGSPTGLPTGPVLTSGPVIRVL